MSKNLIFVRTFSAGTTSIQKVKKVPLKFVETCQTMSIITPHDLLIINIQYYFNRTTALTIEKKDNQQRAHGHTR
jgi:hypothetical protein